MSDFTLKKDKITKLYKEMATLKSNYHQKLTHNNPGNHMFKNICLKLMPSLKLEEHKLPNCDCFYSFILFYLDKSFLKEFYHFKTNK